MVLLYEYRITLPMSVEEYQVAQLYSVAEASKNETGGGEGIEVLVNQPFNKDEYAANPPLLNGAYTEGQYTHKIYHLQSKVPRFIRMLAPSGSLDVTEIAWNAYPYCRTVITNPDYMKDGFYISIETIHLPDKGTTENAHGLPPEKLKDRKVVEIKIEDNSVVSRSDYKPEWDPTKYRSEKAGRGPLMPNWKQTIEPPVMTCYKKVEVLFKWRGLQGRIEKFIQTQEERIFRNFHRQVFCWTDQWYGLTMKDIRELEDRTKQELDEQIKTGPVKGTVASD